MTAAIILKRERARERLIAAAQLDLFAGLQSRSPAAPPSPPAPPAAAELSDDPPAFNFKKLATPDEAATMFGKLNAITRRAFPGMAPELGPGLDPVHRRDERPYWRTAAYQWSGEILAYEDRPAPIELTVRGVRTVIGFGIGFSTHAVDPPGSLYWSETGFRSFTCCASTDPETIRAAIEAHIDGPIKDRGGCGGQLSPWWPMDVLQLRQYRSWIGRREGGADAHLLEQDAKLADRVRASGFDPDAVAPWPHNVRQVSLL